MYVLINFNSYLGGGETLLVRMVAHLKLTIQPFSVCCLKDSFIESEMVKMNLEDNMILFDKDCYDYYYLTPNRRTWLVDQISKHFSQQGVRFVSFCLRDLYLASHLLKVLPNATIVHLALHYQDNLYLGKSLWDKMLKKFFQIERFSRKRYLRLNNRLLNILAKKDAVVPMGDLMVDLWKDQYNIQLTRDVVVPLATYDFETVNAVSNFNNRIIWIGRIVDFKIPALVAMLDFIKRSPAYSLSIVGDGDLNFIKSYIKKNKIDNDRIKFYGEVAYSDLPGVIQDHSIGYAMGTSLIEIARFGLPTVMALGSPDHKLFKQGICGGLFTGKHRGNVGDNLFAGQNQATQPLLEEIIDDIEKDYSGAAERCKENLDNFSFTRNMEKYLNIIDSSVPVDLSEVQIPFPTFVRRWARNNFEGV